MANDKPIVRVIGTGGSIAGVGPDRMDFILYPEIGDHITIQQSLDRVPEIKDIAEVKSEDLVSVGSTAIGAAEWLGLARRINTIFKEEPEIAGVAIGASVGGIVLLGVVGLILRSLMFKEAKPVFTCLEKSPVGAKSPA